MLTVSAPGKVHLIGEHAVVYGHPAIFAAVGKRCYVSAEKNNTVKIKSREIGEKEFSIEEVKLFSKELRNKWNECNEKKDFSSLFSLLKNDNFNTVKAVVGEALNYMNVNDGCLLDIKSDIPMGSGLGSSSALAVAIAGAINELFGKKLTKEQINEIAFRSEQYAHGTPSGGDNTTCCYGGLVWFQKSQPNNIIIPLENEIPHKLEGFVFAYTKKPEKTTGELVQMVRNYNEDERNNKMIEIGKMTLEMKDVLKNKNYKRMKELINKTNDILTSFGLSIEETDKIHKSITSFGGSAKMCGACYGGVMLTWHEDKELLIKTIKDLGFTPFQTDLGVEGIRIEK